MDLDLAIALPTDDRPRAHALARALGFETPGPPAEDGVPEPLVLVANDRARVVYVPTGGFQRATGGRPIVRSGSVECLLSLTVGSPHEVEALMDRAVRAGVDVVVPAGQRPWGYTGVFADPDGHLWEIAHRDG